MLGIQRLRLDPGPVGERIVLEPAGFESFDGADCADRAAKQLAVFKCQAGAEILPPLRNQLDGKHIHQRHADANRREQGIVERHDRGEEDQRHEIQGVGCKTLREQASNLLIDRYPVRDVASVALRKELHRQREHVPQKTADHRNRELGLEAQQ